MTVNAAMNMSLCEGAGGTRVCKGFNTLLFPLSSSALVVLVQYCTVVGSVRALVVATCSAPMRTVRWEFQEETLDYSFMPKINPSPEVYSNLVRHT